MCMREMYVGRCYDSETELGQEWPKCKICFVGYEMICRLNIYYVALDHIYFDLSEGR